MSILKGRRSLKERSREVFFFEVKQRESEG